VRPLYGLRREEVRELLASAGLSWCEDSSNDSRRFARNRVRHVLIPEIQRLAGSAGVENLRAFARAVEELEGHLARATAELTWRPLAAAPACRGAGQAELGGTLPRGPLMALSETQRRRALWRLVLEGTGRAPRRALLDAIQLDLARGRAARHALPAGFALHLRTASLELHPPRRLLDSRVRLARSHEPWLPFPEFLESAEPLAPPTPRAPGRERFLAFGAERAAVLDFSGEVALPDGRAVTLEVVRGDGQRDVPRARGEVELDPSVATRPLAVRWPRPGDRFHPLGAPGSRPLRRVLADWGVPRDERARVPLVVALGAREEIVWVAGVCPAEGARVRPPSAERVRLRLLWAAPEPRRDEAAAREPRAPRGQKSFFEAG
jgi:tRNA(Ile)-lysidine synthase